MHPSTKHNHKYLQLAEYFREQVASGALRPGDQLPTFAQMRSEHGVRQETLDKAYSLLEEERIIVREPKRGTFVADTAARTHLGIVGIALARNAMQFSYYAKILEGIHEAAHREKVEVLLLHEDSTLKWEKMDGIVKVGLPDIQVPLAMPTVSLLSPAEGISYVRADDFGGGKSATRHLISLGHTRIAYLAIGVRPDSQDISKDRIQGYRSAMNEAGLEVNEKWLRALRFSWEMEAQFPNFGYERMTRWLHEDWRELGCTAIIAQNDHHAAGVLGALRHAGIDVPGQVSVVGFDGDELADHVSPALTTVKVPLREVGLRGMEMLLGQIRAGSKAPRDIVREEVIIPTELKIQQSTGPFRDSAGA